MEQRSKSRHAQHPFAIRAVAVVLAIFCVFFCALAPKSVLADADDRPILEPGSVIEDYMARSFKQPYLLQRLAERTYYLSVMTYAVTFYVGDEGVLLIDPLAGGQAGQVLDGIAEITPLPVTVLMYTHSHADHVSDADMIVAASEKAGADLKIIATDITASELRRYPNKAPAPTETLPVPYAEFLFEDEKIQVYTPAAQVHSPDTSVIYLTGEKVAHQADTMEPHSLPFRDFSNSDIQPYIANLELILGLDWNHLNVGHLNLVTRQDVSNILNYVRELREHTRGAMATIDFGSYMMNKTHTYVGVEQMLDDVSEKVLTDMEANWGHYPELPYVIRSHVWPVIWDIVVHEDPTQRADGQK